MRRVPDAFIPCLSLLFKLLAPLITSVLILCTLTSIWKTGNTFNVNIFHQAPRIFHILHPHEEMMTQELSDFPSTPKGPLNFDPKFVPRSQRWALLSKLMQSNPSCVFYSWLPIQKGTSISCETKLQLLLLEGNRKIRTSKSTERVTLLFFPPTSLTMGLMRID